MKRPHVYGDESKCKSAVARYIRSAGDLIDEAKGVRKRLKDAGLLGEFELLGSGWEERVMSWAGSARRGLRRFLQDQTEDVLPELHSGPPKPAPVVAPPGERPSLTRKREVNVLDVAVPWLESARDELEVLRATLGVRRDVSVAAPRPTLFVELGASGLVAKDVISDYEKEMRDPSTPKQLTQAIGAAKELTEATLRAALDRLLGESSKDRDDLPKLLKTWRQAIETKAPPDVDGKEALDKVQAALGSVVTFLAEWRNPYGGGHGRPHYPKGLSQRHARLAIDAAETCVRFIATTMDDLQLLPPSDQ